MVPYSQKCSRITGKDFPALASEKHHLCISSSSRSNGLLPLEELSVQMMLFIK